MSATRLTIFDTTLRDGEQAPGFSHAHRREAAAGAAARRARAWTSSRRGSRSPPTPTPRPCGMIATPCAGRSSRRSRAATRATSIARPMVARARAARGASTPSSPHPTSTSNASSGCRARPASRLAVAAVRRARRYTDDVQFSAEDATRSDLDFLCRVVEAVIAAGCTTINLPDTVGYRDARRDRGLLPVGHRARAELGPCDLQRALPRRPGAGGRQHAGGGRRRRASGRVHDQRHRRARRQRLARGDRDGHAGSVRTACRVTTGVETREIFRVQPDADRAHGRRGAGEQGHRRAATRSRTRPASTRTGC